MKQYIYTYNIIITDKIRHRYGGERIANLAATGSFGIANSRIQIWKHRHLPVAAINMDEFDTDTWRLPQKVSRMIKLAPIADDCMWDQFNEQNLHGYIYRWERDRPYDD